MVYKRIQPANKSIHHNLYTWVNCSSTIELSLTSYCIDYTELQSHSSYRLLWKASVGLKSEPRALAGDFFLSCFFFLFFLVECEPMCALLILGLHFLYANCFSASTQFFWWKFHSITSCVCMHAQSYLFNVARSACRINEGGGWMVPVVYKHIHTTYSRSWRWRPTSTS